MTKNEQPIQEESELSIEAENDSGRSQKIGQEAVKSHEQLAAEEPAPEMSMIRYGRVENKAQARADLARLKHLKRRLESGEAFTAEDLSVIYEKDRMIERAKGVDTVAAMLDLRGSVRKMLENGTNLEDIMSVMSLVDKADNLLAFLDHDLDPKTAFEISSTAMKYNYESFVDDNTVQLYDILIERGLNVFEKNIGPSLPDEVKIKYLDLLLNGDPEGRNAPYSMVEILNSFRDETFLSKNVDALLDQAKSHFDVWNIFNRIDLKYLSDEQLIRLVDSGLTVASICGKLYQDYRAGESGIYQSLEILLDKCSDDEVDELIDSLPKDATAQLLPYLSRRGIKRASDESFVKQLYEQNPDAIMDNIEFACQYLSGGEIQSAIFSLYRYREPEELSEWLAKNIRLLVENRIYKAEELITSNIESASDEDIDYLLDLTLRKDKYHFYSSFTADHIQTKVRLAHLQIFIDCNLMKDPAAAIKAETEYNPAFIIKYLDKLNTPEHPVDLDLLYESMAIEEVLEFYDELEVHGIKIDPLELLLRELSYDGTITHWELLEKCPDVNAAILAIDDLRFIPDKTIRSILKHGADPELLIPRISETTMINNLTYLIRAGAQIDFVKYARMIMEDSTEVVPRRLLILMNHCRNVDEIIPLLPKHILKSPSNIEYLRLCGATTV